MVLRNASISNSTNLYTSIVFAFNLRLHITVFLVLLGLISDKLDSQNPILFGLPLPW